MYTHSSVIAVDKASVKFARPSLPSKAGSAKDLSEKAGTRKTKPEGSSKVKDNTEKPIVKSAYQLFCDSMRVEVKGKQDKY